MHFSEQVYGGRGMFFAGYFFFQVQQLIWGGLGAPLDFAADDCLGTIRIDDLVTTPRSSMYSFLLGLASGFFPGMILYLRAGSSQRSRSHDALFMTAGRFRRAWRAVPGHSDLVTVEACGLAWLFLLEAYRLFAGHHRVFLSGTIQRCAWLSNQNGMAASTLLREQSLNGRTRSSAAFGGRIVDPRVLLLALVYFFLNTCSYGISLASSVVRLFSGQHVRHCVLSAIPICANRGMVLSGHQCRPNGERRWHVRVAYVVRTCHGSGR